MDTWYATKVESNYVSWEFSTIFVSHMFAIPLSGCYFLGFFYHVVTWRSRYFLELFYVVVFLLSCHPFQQALQISPRLFIVENC